MLELLAFGPSDAIPAQEHRGQADFVNAATLPMEVQKHSISGMSSVDIYERLGITVLQPADDLFYSVVLPEGWKKVASDHAMHSYVVDQTGRERIHVFYKAAFYDRNAHASIEKRYVYGTTGYGVDKDSPVVYGVVLDGDTEIWRSEPIDAVTQDRYEANEIAYAVAKAWLAVHYPDYQNPFAYWDVE